MHAPPPPPPPPPAHVASAASATKALAAAQKRWKAAGITSYTYKVTPTASMAMTEEATVVVRGGKATVKPADKAYQDLKTIPRLYAFIERAIAGKPYAITAKFGSTGAPTDLFVDDAKLAVDDNWGFTVRGFKRLT
jgi:hypothetical protein